MGTDHRFQHSEQGLRAILQTWVELPFFEPLVAVAEEYNPKIGATTICQEIAAARCLHWFNVDMSDEEKEEGGILEAQRNRPAPADGAHYRIPSDRIREEAWVGKLTSSKNGTIIVVCGYLHLDELVKRLRAEGHTILKRVYLENALEIREG